MDKPRIIVVIPTIREIQYKSFITAWKDLFVKHSVSLITVWDSETPRVEIFNYGTGKPDEVDYTQTLYQIHKNLVYRYTDACRNLGFIVAAHLQPDYILTLDDDVAPCSWNSPGMGEVDKGNWKNDPIQAHLGVLQKRVPLSWMNTAHDTDLYLRGVPYDIRNEAPVMLSHGVWVGTPDFDGETQLKLEKCPRCRGSGAEPWSDDPDYGERACTSCHGMGERDLPYSLPYYIGHIPKGVLAPICGMNLMVKREALPYLYFAPMGPDTKIDNLNRFADIWMGIFLKQQFDRLGWACYTGGSTILHTRASDSKKNFEQEKLGRLWNEWLSKRIREFQPDQQFIDYMTMYRDKREQFERLIKDIFLNKK